MRIRQADLHEFEVDHGEDTYVVNLETRVCGCYKWSLLGVPCWHALACIQLRRLNYEEFIHQAYHVETYAKTYAHAFKAMPGQSQWEITPYPRPLPPPHRKMPGRPSKKKRAKEPGEDKERNEVKRARKQNKCSRCGGLGHYKTKCNNPIQTTTPPKAKGGRPKSSHAIAPRETGAAAPAGPNPCVTEPATTIGPRTDAPDVVQMSKKKGGKKKGSLKNLLQQPQASQISASSSAPSPQLETQLQSTQGSNT
ncbi:Anion exchange protein 2 [Bienertia sinuspersici]